MPETVIIHYSENVQLIYMILLYVCTHDQFDETKSSDES